MKRLEEISLTKVQRQALADLANRLHSRFDVAQLILFGSVARNETNEESDIDLLILTSHPLDRIKRHEITDLVCEINLEYDTNFSALVVDQKNWENGPVSVLPLRQAVREEGIPV